MSKILIPFQYFDENLPSVNPTGSHFEMFEEFPELIYFDPLLIGQLRPLNTTTGSIGLWETSGDELMPATGSEIDSFFELNDTDDITLRFTTGSFYQDFILIPTFTSSTYEPYKAFSSDNCEYGQVSIWLTMVFPWVYATSSADYSMGLLLMSDNVFSASNVSADLRAATVPDFSDVVFQYPTEVYNGTSSAQLIKGTSPFTTDPRKVYVEYPMNDSWRYYRLYEFSGDDGNFNNISLGLSINLPDTYREPTQVYNFRYPLSSMNTNFLGKVNWSGWATNQRKERYTLSYTEINPIEVDKFLFIFSTAKRRPIWFIDDKDDSDSWKLVSIPNMTITEPYAGAFDIKLTLEEL